MGIKRISKFEQRGNKVTKPGKFNNPQLIVAAVGRPPHFTRKRFVRLSAESRHAKFARSRGIFLPRSLK